jgi:hypothetical protein
MDKIFLSNWVRKIFFNLIYKSDMYYLICEMHIFFNNQDKVGINFTKDSCISHILLKNEHILFL